VSNINFDQASVGTVSSGAEALSVTNTGSGTGVLGARSESHGFLAGRDPLFHGAVGVYGESTQNGVFGRTASNVAADHAVYGQNDGAGNGVTGVSTGTGSTGILAGRDPRFDTVVGVYGQSNDTGVLGRSLERGSGVEGHSTNGTGVVGTSDHGPGVAGISTTDGVSGRTTSDTDAGVKGVSVGKGPGVIGLSGGNGVVGNTNSDTDAGVNGGNGGSGFGVFGGSVGGHGVRGQNGAGSGLRPDVGTGVYGDSDNGFGVYASSGTNVGVFGESQTTNGVFGVTHSSSVAAVSGVNKNGGIGVFGEGRIAGSFSGDVEITGDLTIFNGKDIRLSDFAEDFDVSGLEEIEPGNVVVLDDEGSVRQSRAAYDHKVAGVVSGAGNFRSAITLDRHKSQGTRKAIALMGKVYCKADAQYSAIGVGDLLTTSATPGHAMKAIDPLKAFGSVIGKALRPLDAGQGMIPILIALQ
jgi:hypothetical protein